MNDTVRIKNTYFTELMSAESKTLYITKELDTKAISLFGLYN